MCLRWRVEDIGGMSDLCMYELEDNVWDDFGESDDHIVPHPNNKQGNQSSAECDDHRKLQSEVIGITSNADASTKYRVPGKGKREIQPVNDHGTMLENRSWSHTPDGVFPESTKGPPVVASDNTRICNHSFKAGNAKSDSCEFCAEDSIMGDGCTADDNALYRYPLGQMSQSDNDLSFLDNQQEDKDNGDLLYYGWPDIGNFEDVDRMFRSCDSTFGMQSLNNDEDMCWFPSSNDTGITEDSSNSGVQSSGQKSGLSKDASDHNESLQLDNEGNPIHASSKKYVSVGNNMGPLDRPCFLDEEETKSENIDMLVPKEQIICCKKQPMEEENTDQYLENGSSCHHYNSLKQIIDMKLPSGVLSSQVYSTPDIQQHQQSTGPDSMTYIQRQYVQLDYSSSLDQITAFQTPSGTKSENYGCPSPSLKESSYASSQSQSMESSHGLSIEIPALTMSEKGENQQSCQGFQSPFARDFDNATTTNTLTFCGMVSNQKQVQHSKNQIEGQHDVKGGNVELPAELDSSNVQESSCMSTMMDDISLEATSFRQLQQAMEKLDVRTKLCIRDSLYRLARSAEQRHNCANQAVRKNVDSSGASIVEETNKCTGFMDIETDTNPIDRSIAHLLFHRPSDPSRVATNDSLSLSSHKMIREPVFSPQVLAEKQVCREEKETLITNDSR